MPVLTRFQTLRPAQWISGEAINQAGLPLYPDDQLSDFAKLLTAAADQEAYSAAIARFRKSHQGDIVVNVGALGPLLRALYDWFNFVARPVKAKRLNAFIETLKASDLPHITTEWRRFADSLVLAIEDNFLSKNFCIDLQLLIRICYLLQRFIGKTNGKPQLDPDVTDELIAELLSRSIVLPPRVLFDRCRRNCSEPNSMVLPTPGS